jgi:hypothetical protein
MRFCWSGRAKGLPLAPPDQQNLTYNQFPIDVVSVADVY